MASKLDKVFTTAHIADVLGVEFVGSGSVEITGVSSIEQAGQTHLSFITSSKFAGKVSDSKAAAVIVHEKLEKTDAVQLIAGSDVGKALIAALNLFAPQLAPAVKGVHPSAVTTAVCTDLNTVFNYNTSVMRNEFRHRVNGHIAKAC